MPKEPKILLKSFDIMTYRVKYIEYLREKEIINHIFYLF